ncbi:MAG TPA: RDD family protein [Thermoanaerobaculia bacterium]|nr:RDD family protein [Thermoanaerobaculia bacterium]
MSAWLSQGALLRIAAFLADALSAALLLLFVSTIVSYSMAWTGGSGKSITMAWFASGAALVLYLLLRDSAGRSPGKKILGLKVVTPSGRRCGPIRSFTRNLPLLVPGVNVIEAVLLVFGSTRLGDRMAGTRIVEE